ncbi:MAG: hypothetical protein JSS81_28075 [Acidobacteria bacterium]|nr:hypothetical protein [Acidobacteriota bacterium]
METAITFQHKGPPFDELLGISDEMSMDFATLTSDGQWMGKVELLQLEVAGQKPEDTSVKADFAHTGYALLTFLTRDIESAKHACERAGATIVVEPAQFNRPFHENSRVMIVRSPGGEYLEIIEEDYSGG